MSATPYDPRYNAKIYIPKLTEEERRARATPLENLRSLRFRTQVTTAPAPMEAINPTPAAPPPPKDEAPTPVTPAPVPVPTVNTTEPRHIPSAREVVFAEFPELYRERCGQTHGKSRQRALCLIDAALVDGPPDREPPSRAEPNAPRSRSGTWTNKVHPVVKVPPQEDTGVEPRHEKVPKGLFRASSPESPSPLPLMQSFRFGSPPGARPHSPPALKLHR